jgi:NADH-quinone oxidoreductase subunit K
MNDLLAQLPKSVPISWYLALSAILFVLGVAGFLFRRNIITVFMSIELMLNAVNLTFVTFTNKLASPHPDGHIFSFFVMVVAAAEAAVGLAIILTIFKNRLTLEIDEVSSLKN